MVADKVSTSKNNENDNKVVIAHWRMPLCAGYPFLKHCAILNTYAHFWSFLTQINKFLKEG